MINQRHLFLGKINGQNIVFDKINYEMKGLQPRLNFVNWMLKKNDDFLVEYFDKYFVFNPNCWDATSHENNVCQRLDQLGTYLLTEIPEKKSKLQYRFYNGERNFQNALRKEYSLDKIVEDLSSKIENQTDGDVMYFLERETNNHSLPKTIKVMPQDLKRHDEIGRILNEYEQLKQNIIKIKQSLQDGTYKQKTSYRPNTYKLKHIIGMIDGDMLDVKTQMSSTIIFNNALQGRSVSCWDDVDFLNPVHVECFLKLTNNPNDFDSDLSMLLNYFNLLYDKVKINLTKKELEVLQILRWGNRRVEDINSCLKTGYEFKQVDVLYEIDFKELEQIISKTTFLIMNEHIVDVQNFLDKRLGMSLCHNPLKMKKCSCCNRIRTLSNFQQKKDMADGYRNQCKFCVNEILKSRKIVKDVCIDK